ncbi:MAG TPA: hypothetical protein VMU92_08030 [Acidobacteriaceae bacterium]|nr:hypothetical protein [Acidobacteriaceae bacterium]
MKTQKTVSFRINAVKVEALDKIAANARRDRSFLLNEAVDAYLEWNADFEQSILRGIQDAREGRVVDHEVVRRRLNSVGKKRKTA